MGDLKRSVTLEGSEQGFATSRVDALLGWARKYSLFAYPFVTACCGMEFMAVTGARFDIEAVFVYPWAIHFRDLGWLGLAEMLSFLAVVLVALVYVWKKGALEWET